MKNLFKKFMPLMLIFTLLLSLAGCGTENKPEDAINSLIAALKEVNMEKAEEYINTGSLSSINVDSLDGGDAIIEAVFSSLSCQIVSTEKSGSNAAVVKTQITTLDLTAILGQCTMQVMQEYTEGKITDEDVDSRTEEVFKETITQDGLPTVTNEVDITVEKVDNIWKVDVDDELQNAISGGFLGAVANAQSSMPAAQ